MSAELEDGLLELSIPQGTRDYAGPLIIGVGGLLSDPPGAMLSVSDTREPGQQAVHLTLRIGDVTVLGEWRLSLLETYKKRGHGFARLTVGPAKADQ
jgi:hypothetical protein